MKKRNSLFFPCGLRSLQTALKCYKSRRWLFLMEGWMQGVARYLREKLIFFLSDKQYINVAGLPNLAIQLHSESGNPEGGPHHKMDRETHYPSPCVIQQTFQPRRKKTSQKSCLKSCHSGRKRSRFFRTKCR